MTVKKQYFVSSKSLYTCFKDLTLRIRDHLIVNPFESRNHVFMNAGEISSGFVGTTLLPATLGLGQ